MGRTLEFTKMHGAGNDFVVLDGLSGELPAVEGLAARLLDRRLGIGGDQLLVARPSSAADFRMDIYNPDGSRAEMCANGIRAFTKWLRDRGHTQRDEIEVETLSGVVRPRWAGKDLVRVDMGPPILEPEKIPTVLGSGGGGPVIDESIDVNGERVPITSVSMGNPHAVLYVEDVDAEPVEAIGRCIENHPVFPNRVNVEFAQVVDREHVRQRTWERGAGETLACGSGACAVVVASILKGLTERRVAVELRGGTLDIEWASETASVIMTGPAAEVFTGRYPLEED